ncbi:cytochrome P450 [Aspergillus pseudoustus]|uniref:Cytochrome P450 n=1 Tax=Aspergillus pseudoustus TaxID=1810923 RepID=A0ABR4J736_9EURO
MDIMSCLLIARYSKTAALVVVAIFLARTTYSGFIYPAFLTPLRAIPTPKLRSWTKGSYTIPPLSLIAQLRLWKSTIPNRGLIRYYLPGNQERVLVTSVEALNDILVAKAGDFTKPAAVRSRLSLIAGNGLLLSEGEVHKAQRKALMPAFSFRHVKNLYPVFWAKAVEMAECIEGKFLASGDDVDRPPIQEIRNWATRATLDIVGAAALGHDFGSLRTAHNALLKQYRLMRQDPSRLEMLVGVGLSLFTRHGGQLLSIFPTRRTRTVKEASNFVRTFCRDLVLEKRKEPRDGEDCKAEKEQRMDIASVAFRSAVLTDDELVDQMMTFLAAGHGTTSHALQWAVYALCKDHDVQQRLRDELREHGINKETTPTFSPADIDTLPYLRAICNETLRLYPPVPSTIREATRETVVAGYRIPAGTQFAISPAVVNVDAELWGPDAGTFNPDRWMGEGRANSGGVRNHHGFLTFLQGPRSCIGAAFAKAELACLVAALVVRFRMELEDPGKEEELTKQGVGSGPADGVHVRFELVK